ncbi:hypothetical protein AMATHDRAFT_85310 [Amanita thiersii Skay4041]|uniref:Helicase ATP-binding domain-containing protein n=1 Tax=Amanita thiersii Skay4041 TaxID=703135 RepID=A0A2A9NSB6_9AGAR|nr:hypothetical protein AMATHDRAFT_85310 [Amanita thiersii Skay4041]
MPIEELRKRFAGDLNLYPHVAVTGYRDERKGSHSAISISSEDSPVSSIASAAARSQSTTSSTLASQPNISSKGAPLSVASSSATSINENPIRVKKHNKVVLSDEEDDSEEDDIQILESRSQPLKAQQRVEFPIPKVSREGDYNGYPDHGQHVHPIYKVPGQPVHIPSNRDLPPPTRPPLPPNKPYDLYGFNEPGLDMSTAEADKAVKDLIAGSINEDIVAEINPEDMVVPGFKEGIELLPHQVLGRIWMRERETGKKMGGILADDMGLGKTIQTLTRIVEGRPRRADAEEGWSASTLVICPLALVGQWSSEISKMANGFSTITHHGPSRTSDPNRLRAHVVITTYDVVKSEYEAFCSSAKDESQAKGSKKQGSFDSSDEDSGPRSKPKPKTSRSAKKTALFNVQWWRVVLDEAHNIKNEKTKGAIACCELKAKYRWCLTGTPMQNNVQELHSLFKFLHIRPLNDRQRFEELIGKPLKSGKGAGHAMKKLRAVLQEVMLRRTKDQTLNGKRLIELPGRLVNVVSCSFDSYEQAFYASLETKMADTLEKLMASKSGNSAYMSVLLLLLRLRQACNHPVLVTKDFKKDVEAVNPKSVNKGETDKDGDADDLVAAFNQLGVTRKCQFCTTELVPENAAEGEWCDHCIECAPLAQQAQREEEERPTSAKIRKMLEILRDVEERSDGTEKTIIFSQFTSMLDLVEPFLKDEGIKYVRFRWVDDGSMKPVDREAALSKIQEDARTRVILISFKAGSTGLNLTVCNNVILLDLWWNPALEDQAFDRAHRFGQTRDVNIFKLKIDNTVEDRILELQEKKRALAKAALSGAKLKGMHLGFDELLGLLNFGRDEEEEDSD